MSAPVLTQRVSAALALFLITAGPAAAQPAAPPPLPPLLQPASTEHHPGKIIDELLATPNLAESKQFYGGLFGWTFQDISLGQSTYSQAFLAGQPVAGFVSRPLPPQGQHRPGWLALISAQDVSALTTAATQRGAKLLFGPRDIAGLGQEAILADPQGAPFGVLASSSGDPADKLVPAGGWIWNVLFAHDPEADAGFYQALFNDSLVKLPGRDEAGHFMLATEDFARAGVNPMPPGQTGAPAYWLSFVRVPNAATAAAKAVSLGGRMLLSPRTDRHGGQIAVIADPGGAPFGVMEWAEQDAGLAK